jgi:Complex I intermediate-associated protein 30 (CIA30)
MPFIFQYSSAPLWLLTAATLYVATSTIPPVSGGLQKPFSRLPTFIAQPSLCCGSGNRFSKIVATAKSPRARPGDTRATNRISVSVSMTPTASNLESAFVARHDDTKQLIPLLDFRRNNTIDFIDRLDDAIMGGISTSTVREGKNYSVWSGICRTDGGGFCGFRTNPFKDPLLLNNYSTGTSVQVNMDGFYVRCRLVSDNEPERRVWKLTTRTKPDRGELLYQAPVNLTKCATPTMEGLRLNGNAELLEWQTIFVPFDSFRLVRGPRIVENGPALNVSSGVYQIGMSMSQFLFAASTNSTEKTLSDFRDGYFELQLQDIGLYSNIEVNTSGAVVSSTIQESPNSPATLENTFSQQLKVQPLNVNSKDEVKQQQPVLIKVLLFVSKLLFSEER